MLEYTSIQLNSSLCFFSKDIQTKILIFFQGANKYKYWWLQNVFSLSNFPTLPEHGHFLGLLMSVRKSCAVHVCLCVNICVNVCEQKMFLPRCGKIPSWVQNSSFQQQVTVSASELRPESKQHLATLATLALTQLQCFCLIRSWGILSLCQTAGLKWSETKCKICIFPFWIRFHFQFSWRSARKAVTRWIYFYCQDNLWDY